MNGYDAFTLRRIKPGIARIQCSEQSKGVFSRFRKFLCFICGNEPIACADEKLIVKHIPESRQCPADSRVGQAKFTGSVSCTPVPIHCQKNLQVLVANLVEIR